MLKTITMIAGFLLLAALPVLAAETVYSSVIDDLPLMQGMAERQEDTVVFDNPGGRIVTFSATTAAPPAAVRDFYRQALPPLGWNPAPPSGFARDGETLKMDFEKNTAGTLVRFTLTPDSEGK